MRRQTLISKSLAAAALFFCALLATVPAAAQQRDWQPQRTWVFVVGILKWQDPETFSSFPQANRRDAQLVDFFRRQGVPAPQLVYLKDEQATTRTVTESLASLLSQTRSGDLLFFYYTGHGYKSDDGRTTYFATFDADDQSGWSTRSIVKDIEKYFKGSRAILTADTCYSGSLVSQVRWADPRISYAVLTSSLANQTSTENWTFTETLLGGLSGSAFADANGDGRITLGELAADIHDDLRFAESQQSASLFTGAFSSQTILASAPPRRSPDVSRRVLVKPGGGWYFDWYKARIIDADGSRFRIHFFGWQDSEDEWVEVTQIRNDQRRRKDVWLTSGLGN